MVEDLLKIPLDNKEFNKQMKQMNARGDRAVAFAKKHYNPALARGGDPEPGDPIPSKHGYRPQAKKCREYWPFPGGLGLNIPHNVTSKIRLKRLTRVIEARREAYARDPVAYFESLKGDDG